jgi:hypothetical protein
VAIQKQFTSETRLSVEGVTVYSMMEGASSFSRNQTVQPPASSMTNWFPSTSTVPPGCCSTCQRSKPRSAKRSS